MAIPLGTRTEAADNEREEQQQGETKGKDRVLSTNDGAEIPHHPEEQYILNVRGLCAPGQKVTVQLYETATVAGRGGIFIPAPLDEFGEQRRLASKVMASNGSRLLVPQKDFDVQFVTSDQGQPFFFVHVNGDDAETKIEAYSLVSLPVAQNQVSWRQRAAAAAARPIKQSTTRKFEYAPPPIRTFDPALQQVLASIGRRGLDAPAKNGLQVCLNLATAIRQSGSNSLNVPTEDPALHASRSRDWNCGHFGVVTQASADALHDRTGQHLGTRAGFWGTGVTASPHVQNYVIIPIVEHGKVTAKIVIIDASEKRPLYLICPQDQTFVTTSVADCPTFTKAQHLLPNDPIPSYAHLNVLMLTGGLRKMKELIGDVRPVSGRPRWLSAETAHKIPELRRR
ncbi:hypothetical protein HYR82_02635 [Candidatus Peregrinibacteria bacterium]|nr:hypothetical protein [Candidatus Peregrinibacteria bacterium]